jgi:hypothetical protein
MSIARTIVRILLAVALVTAAARIMGDYESAPHQDQVPIANVWKQPTP